MCFLDIRNDCFARRKYAISSNSREVSSDVTDTSLHVALMSLCSHCMSGVSWCALTKLCTGTSRLLCIQIFRFRFFVDCNTSGKWDEMAHDA